MLGAYEILSPLGAGGMGEVYRAGDTKLNRDVALKVLPEAFAADPQRMARFEREAQVLASLNHPNIAAIYGLEESGPTRALVMELVEGETLAERIGTIRPLPPGPSPASGQGEKGLGLQPSPLGRGWPRGAGPGEGLRGAALQVDEALQIAKQVADALEYAHERGVVHRDLKPANIKITPEGVVKVLDFGLAKALGPALTSSPSSSGRGWSRDAGPGEEQESPTLSLAMTQAGFILGTAAYMSPEQAKAKPVDRRADIWAFGCVLYEMLSGQKAFDGETVSDVLAAVIMKDPDWSALPETTPPSIERLIRRCLNKDPKQRLQAMGEARITIEEAISGTGPDWIGAGVPPVDAHGQDAQARPSEDHGPEGRATRPLQRALPWAIAALAIPGLLVTLVILWRDLHPTAAKPMELSLAIPPGRELYTADGPAIVVSPDGSRIAYVVGTLPQTQIYIRELDKSDATPLEGAKGASPFFSPDGQWLGFYSDDGKLKIVSVFGGAPFVVAEANSRRGASWGEDGIVFPEDVTAGLSRVSLKGGKPVAVTQLDAARNEITHRWPQILPGGKIVLFTASADNNNFVQATVEASSLATGKVKVLVENAYFGRYLASGYLTYVSGGTLFAAPFDSTDLKLTGPPMPVLQDIESDLTNGSAQLSFAKNGTAVYLTGQALASQVTVALVDRKGNATPLVEQPGDYFAPSFSPDGKQLAMQEGVGNVMVYDLARKTLTPLTFSNPQCIFPIWTPDGKRITCFRPSAAGVGPGMSWLPSDGSGGIQTLTKTSDATRQFPFSWSPDGRTLAFAQYSSAGGCCNIGLLTVSASDEPGEAKTFLEIQREGVSGSYYAPAFSPDGHWLAYVQDVSGLWQVFVSPYPGPGGKWQVSVAGGEFPVWSRTRHDLYFISVGTTLSLNSVPYSIQGNSFQPGTPTLLFHGIYENRNPYPAYDVAPDGKHFAMLQPVGGKSSAAAPPTVVLNWFARVAQLTSSGRK
jgi:serine/threonine protein kinase/Tol biopolymer transport system component